MKKLIVLGAFALCAVTASAQNISDRKNEKSSQAINKQKGYGDDRPDKDLNPGTDKAERKALKKAEKEQRKMAKKAEKQYRKDDKNDDGILNGSAKDNHGRWVSKTAKETTLEGREKGKAISEVAKSKSMNKGKSNQNGTEKSKNKASSHKQAGQGHHTKG